MRKRTAVALVATTAFAVTGVVAYNEVGPGSVAESNNPSGDGNAGYDPTHPQNGDNTEAPAGSGASPSVSATHRAAASCALIEVLLNDGVEGTQPGTVRTIFRVANGVPGLVVFTSIGKNTATVSKVNANPLDAEAGNTVADAQFAPTPYDNNDGEAHAKVEVTTVATEGNPAQTVACGEVVSVWQDGALTSVHAG
ncbi:MAG TPA: hypothetical protein VLH86_01140 [Patescibacteria group bacterium]|nr:hypothetical protein [Patescibacteria group bacterium]